MTFSYLGADVNERGILDLASNYIILTTEFTFPEDGRIQGWILWAQNAGRVRFQVIFSRIRKNRLELNQKLIISGISLCSYPSVHGRFLVGTSFVVYHI